MEKLDLNPNNLIRVGVTPELLQDAPAFIHWLENNQNIYIDIVNNCIYTDLVDPLNSDLKLLKSHFENENDYKAFINPIIENANEKFNTVLKTFPIENQKEFLINSLPTLFENVKAKKNIYYNLRLNEIIVTQKPIKKTEKDQTPFKVALKFANGEAQNLYKLYKNDKGHFTKIAVELGFKKTDKVYFTSTLQNTDNVKNVYLNKKIIKLVYTHCLENSIIMENDFLQNIQKSELQ